MRTLIPLIACCAIPFTTILAQQPAPTHNDIKYGPHERNVMDVWLAKSETPSPILVSIHGGGFRAGRKSVDVRLLRKCLDAGISVVAITYRFSQDAIAPAAMYDSARAVQFVRAHGREWNIDPSRIAATGGSAGAGISLWLAFHDDLADPQNTDPVLRESSRLVCAAVYNGQSTYDPRTIRKLIPEADTWKHSALAEFFAVDLDKLDELPEEKYKLFEEVSALPHVSKDDVPVMMLFTTRMDTPITGQGIGIHHPRFGYALQERMQAVGLECRIEEGVTAKSGEYVDLPFDFIKTRLQVSN